MTQGFSLPPADPDSPPYPHEAAPPSSLFDDLRLVVTDGRNLAEAEVAYQLARIRAAGAGAGRIAGMAALALALVFFALMALVIGLILGLAPLLTAWGATGVVVVGLLALALACLLAARRRFRRLTRLLSDDKGAQG